MAVTIPPGTLMWIELHDFYNNKEDPSRITWGVSESGDQRYIEYCSKVYRYKQLKYSLEDDEGMVDEGTKEEFGRFTRPVYDAPIPKISNNGVRSYEDGPRILYFRSEWEAATYIINQE